MISNHPVHILTKDKQLSPSAFIPFCEFGGKMSPVTIKIQDSDIPVCNSFQATVLNDQLCYEVDLNKLSIKDNIDKELEWGFNFIMDYNEDRQVTVHKDLDKKTNLDWTSYILELDQDKEAFIYLNTIGKSPS